MSRCTWLFMVALLHACGDETTKRDERPPTAASDALAQAVPRNPIEPPLASNVATTTYELDGRPIRLETSAESCWIAADLGAGAMRVALDLTPPCYVLRWQAEVDRAGPDVSDGMPVGQPGSVAAWRYRKPAPFTVFAVVGDPVPEDSDLRKSLTYKQVADRQPPCVCSIQAVLVKQGQLSAGKKSSHGGIACPDTVEPQPTYWILSHD